MLTRMGASWSRSPPAPPADAEGTRLFASLCAPTAEAVVPAAELVVERDAGAAAVARVAEEDAYDEDDKRNSCSSCELISDCVYRTLRPFDVIPDVRARQTAVMLDETVRSCGNRFISFPNSLPRAGSIDRSRDSDRSQRSTGMDQDHHLASSSVAWDEANDDAPLAQTSTAYSAYTSSSTAADATVAGASATTRSARPNQLVVRVLDGKTELEGTSDMFVSYLVTSASASAPSAHETDATTTTSPATTSSRRRFQDFNFLRHALVKDFPACVVPPLPDKHRMEYVVGDRFSSEFIERRRIE